MITTTTIKQTTITKYTFTKRTTKTTKTESCLRGANRCAKKIRSKPIHLSETQMIADFKDKFVETSHIGKLMIETKEGVTQKAGAKWEYKNKLKNKFEDAFKDIGYVWCGHQKFVENCVKKYQYYTDIVDARKNALKFGACGIVMTMKGFSLRYGTALKNTNQCGSGMGVWMTVKINIDQMIKNPSTGLTNYMKKICVSNCYIPNPKKRGET